MAGSLTEFGARCRQLRILRRATMQDQARSFGCDVSTISKLELGERKPPEAYAEKFADWLRLPAEEKANLIKMAAAKSNVLRFRPKNAQHARRLFRKINKLSPKEIRNLGKAPERASGDDRRRIR